jgi:predicted Zn-dependent protease
MLTDSTKAMLTVERVQELYNRNLFLDAFQQSAEYWMPSTRLEDLSVAELILGGRLASRLGGSRLSRHLFKTALERDSADPTAIYYSSYIHGRGTHLFNVLREFEANPEIAGADAEIQSSRLAYHAVICASLRDFARAHHYIACAREYKTRDGWVFSCESDVLGFEDRWPDALKAAERSWEISPGTPFAARSITGCLLNLRRVQEAADRLSVSAETGQSYEVTSLACWYLCALAETHTGDERGNILQQAQQFAQRLENLAPLADRDTRISMARTHLDIAEMSDDHAAMERWAAEAKSPFHRTVLENMRANPQGQRIRLPFRRAIQKHNACLPTSLSSAMAVEDVHIDPDTMAAEITFGGTQEWAAAEWLEKRGLVPRFFAVTPEIAKKLIRNGIAFVITLEGDSSAHAVAAVGLDEAAGTLIIHDPQSFRTTEYLLKSIGEGQTPLGPLGTVIVPPAKAALVDQLLPADNAETIRLEQAHRRETVLHGPAAARTVLADLIERYPSHPVTRYLQAIEALNEGQSGKALIDFQQLAVEYPNAAFVRSSLLASCRALQNTAVMRGVLADAVERGRLPGVQSQQEWVHPPASYVSEYADFLRNSAETQHKARTILLSQIRNQPSYGPSWHILGDLLWHERNNNGALLAYRIASCLSESNEHYAAAYCDALVDAGREADGLKWLEDRVRQYGSSTSAVATWTTWISALEKYGHPEQALTASDEALAQHSDSPELLAFVVPFVARMGKWNEAEALLLRLESSGNKVLFREAAVAFYRMRGDLEKSIQHAQRWVIESPLSMDARHELVSLVAKRDGVYEAAALAKQWAEERSGHDELESLYYQQLDRSQATIGKKYTVLMRRLKRNPQDAWAWREVAFQCVYQYSMADGKRQERMKRRLERLIAQCDRTSPGDVATLRLHAEWKQEQVEWSQAIDMWMEAIDRGPKELYSYRHAWDCASHLDAARRQEIWERMQSLFLGSTGALQIARDLVLMAAQRFGVAVAEQAASQWCKARPDDPGAIEAYADLLLEHGHGRTDFERALEILVPATARFPYYSDLRFSQADALRKLGRFPEAEEVLNEIARRRPDNSQAQIQLARVQERRGQVEEALHRLDGAILRDPQNISLVEIKIEILRRAQRLEEAVAVIDAALLSFPKSVSWREKSIRFLLECRDAEAAIQAARGGIVVYPKGAYLWLLLGRTLFEHSRFAAQGEIESILRQSLALNPGLYETADYLAMLLVDQRRFTEAAELMHKIVNRLDDPSSALGRLAWIHRQEGKKHQALAELTALMTDSPSYRWGWNVLIAWLEEDKEWGTARQLLTDVPPEVRTDVWFRQKRLQLMDKAGFTDAKLDSEWKTLLSDFPEEAPLHLIRYDFLHERKRVFEAMCEVEAVRALQPENPYMLARFAEALAESGKKDVAIQTALLLFFASAEPSVWPPNYAWDAMRKAQYEEEVFVQARARMEQGAIPTVRTMAIFARYVTERNGTAKRVLQPWWRTWLPTAGPREILRLLRILDAHSVKRPIRGPLLRKLSDFGYQRRVVGYWRKHKEPVQADVDAWSETARALAGLKHNKRETIRFMQGWRERAGMQMWVVTNLIICYSPFRRKHLREMAAACHDALAGLAHDHCARFLAYIEAESYVLMNDKKAFQEAWQRNKNYFEGKIEDNEWFQVSRRHLAADILQIARALEAGSKSKYRSLRRMLWREQLFATLRGFKIKRKRSVALWIFWGIWILWILSRLLQNQ